ncbi:MAG: broad specificity phosphatase PhoE [Myxococcota bacterium]|jgi:broad specificity phosphatase PhoE
MPDIWLIRHGQAGDVLGDYDRLSDLGVLQAAAAGARWQHLRPVSRVLTGAMVRHHRTRAVFEEAFGALPTAAEDPRWNEFDHLDVIQVAQRAGLKPADSGREGFMRFFLTAMTRWSEGRHDEEYVEPYAAFQARVEAGVRDLADDLAPGEVALVFTSGGAIAAVCRSILGLSPLRAFEINTVLVNTGFTRLRVGRGRVSLATLNAHPHIDAQPGLLTLF